MNRLVPTLVLPLLCFAVNSLAQAVPVKVIAGADGASWHLTRGGQPYFIKGAGGSGSMEELRKAGANSLRTWGVDNLQPTLDKAQQLGLTIAAGIWLGHREQGFDYNSADQVAAQYESAKKAILQYKDSPALLAWGIGNEMEGYGKGDDASIWSAVEAIAALAHKLDPNHPTMTVVAEIGGDKVKNIERLCPDVDIVGINSYGGGPSIPQRYRAAGGHKPYVLTEFGPAGTWEGPKTAWGTPIELTSTEKAAAYRRTYEGAVANQNLCLGSYAFTWGFKREATATWFGMLLPDGTHVAAVDTMSELWSGRPPADLCPAIQSLKVDGSDEVDPGGVVRVSLAASDPAGQPLKVRWVFEGEPAAYGTGGQGDAAPPAYPEAIVKADSRSAELHMPSFGGGYRLYAYVTDGKGGAATANVPLHVRGGGKAPIAAAAKAALPLVVYGASAATDEPYIPAGYMGDTKSIKMDPQSTESPRAGKSCLKVDFDANTGWGGVVWQSPANDWGDHPGGRNLTGAKALTFWARGAKGGEKVTFLCGIIGEDKPFHDSTRTKLADVVLTDKWQQYSIDLKGKDLSRIKTGFGWTTASSGQPVVFYLDDIRYE